MGDEGVGRAATCSCRKVDMALMTGLKLSIPSQLMQGASEGWGNFAVFAGYLAAIRGHDRRDTGKRCRIENRTAERHCCAMGIASASLSTS